MERYTATQLKQIAIIFGLFREYDCQHKMEWNGICRFYKIFIASQNYEKKCTKKRSVKT